MKINKKYFLIRLITSPLKLIFLLFWYVLFSVLKTFQWVIYGGDEVIFGKDLERNTVGELIKEVQKLRI
ncbi:hypothetical protein EG340_06995 [Chryseobacterium indoltheticum]|uniref:Uncharacterized protein n=1 Tax=Chryseobacterium indoltheticum TaxID=254 RepID=A0A3G6MYI0_9FLAO|nr:hypothetical protein EG340_06995 [Chryseobacterium indoltheticum]